MSIMFLYVALSEADGTQTVDARADFRSPPKSETSSWLGARAYHVRTDQWGINSIIMVFSESLNQIASRRNKLKLTFFRLVYYIILYYINIPIQKC